MFFDDGALHATRSEDEKEDGKHANIDHGQDQDQQRLTGKETAAHVERRKKLSNLTFSADIHAALVPAQLVFLCLEMDPSAGASVCTFPYLTAQVFSSVADEKLGRVFVTLLPRFRPLHDCPRLERA
jgi:hypothetical protein